MSQRRLLCPLCLLCLSTSISRPLATLSSALVARTPLSAVEGSPESTGLVDTPARAAQHAAQRALAAFTLPPAAAAYVELARPRFVAKACGMVLASAAAAAQSPAAVLEPTVWAAAAVTALITAGSMMVNDYFDWKAGVDAVNDPGRAIPSGRASADTALLAGMALYVAALSVACMLPCSALRGIAVGSAVLTLLYTPLLKPVAGLKTVSCAAVMAASPVFAAYATLVPAAVDRAFPAAALVFGCMTFRETVADVADRFGDAAGNIRTLPIVIGSRSALTATAAVATACCVAAAAALARSTTATCAACGRDALAAAAAGWALAAVFLAVTAGRVVHVAGRVVQAGCDPAVARWGKDQSFAPVAAGLGLLALAL